LRQPYKIVGGATKSTDTAEPPNGLQESRLSLTALVAGRQTPAGLFGFNRQEHSKRLANMRRLYQHGQDPDQVGRLPARIQGG
jgi:hypothetical protein